MRERTPFTGDMRQEADITIKLDARAVDQIGRNLANLMRHSNRNAKVKNEDERERWDGKIYHVIQTLIALGVPFKIHETDGEIYLGESERDESALYTGIEVCGKMFEVS